MPALDDEVSNARKGIFRDGYDMSLGEIVSLYQRGELIIGPEYQRLFRWDETKKSRFIESLLLNIPIPPIFVFSDDKGNWELVDGLQRISTVLEFIGILKNGDGAVMPPFSCAGTKLLPSLSEAVWGDEEEGPEPETNVISIPLKNSIRRSRIRVEILAQETDAMVKYELFQRLNTGGASLSEQEIRNVILISINREAYTSILSMSQLDNFQILASVGQERIRRQFLLELAVRFVALRNFPYKNGMDVHDYLDTAAVTLANNKRFDWGHEQELFEATMNRLMAVVGQSAFKKNDRWSLGLYEFIALGLSKALDRYPAHEITDDYIRERVAAVARLPETDRYSGMGVRGTQRLAGLVMPLAEAHFALPDADHR